MRVTKKDVLWSYLAQFFNVAYGFITLPIILRMLSTNEIGVNYLMLTLSSFASLFDFGFSPQFARNFTYIFSGSQELKKVGVNVVNEGKINYPLLTNLIKTAEYVYRIIAFSILVMLLTVGTYYMYNATNEFTSVNNVLHIWIVFCISVCFNIYFSYYMSLVLGKGLIMESRKAVIYSKSAYVVFVVLFLYSGFGLMSVALATFLMMLVERYLLYRSFYTKELKKELLGVKTTKEERQELFGIIWHNAKKLGLVFLGGFAISKASMFLAGIYLPLSEISSFGLMMQLVNIISGVASTIFLSYQSRFASLRITGDKKSLISDFAFGMNSYYLLYISGVILLVFLAPHILKLIGSNAILPGTTVIIVYCVATLLEQNHSNFSSIIVTGNNVPFVKAALISGFTMILLYFFSLKFTSLGLLALVSIQAIVQAAYNNWKWPYVILKEFQISMFSFLKLGFRESYYHLKALFNKYF